MIEFTTKQIAELLGVSKPTVQKTINKLAVRPERTDNRNRAFYSYGNTVKIIAEIRPNYDFTLLNGADEEPQNVGANPQNVAPNTAKPQNFVPNEPPSTAKPQIANEELEFLKRALSVIEAQLAEKDKQLAVKDKQIDELNKRLDDAMQLNKGLQYITAADKTTELLEANNKQQEEQPIIINEADVAAASSSDQEIGESKKEEPQKKSWWQRLFS